MKKFKLEDIEKKHGLKAPPERYFDELPGIIQAQTAHKATSKRNFAWSGALRYALPAVVVLLVVVFIIRGLNQQDLDPESMIADVAIEEVMAYLEETDISTEELIASVDWDEASLDFEKDLEGAGILDEIELQEEDMLELFQEYNITEEYL
ncbi:MAG: hypothetical protein ACR2MX_15980 [Cyclobacteriaceae bacterium]